MTNAGTNPQKAMLRARGGYVAAALGTIGLGLLVVWRGQVLGHAARDVLGDMLWAAMVAWWAGALAPAVRLVVRTTTAYSVCVAVEFSQLYHTPMLDVFRQTRLGHLVLGNGFDPRDLVAYALGVAVAVVLEMVVVRWQRTGVTT